MSKKRERIIRLPDDNWYQVTYQDKLIFITKAEQLICAEVLEKSVKKLSIKVRRL